MKGDLPKYRMTKSGYMSNVEGTVLADLGTAFDVLEQLPRVQVKDDKVSIIGRTGAPLIYINGRLMRDRNELRQLQSKDIKDIEVITNPGPQYASNVASVIRIRTRRRQGEGFSGSLSHYNRWTVKCSYNDEKICNFCERFAFLCVCCCRKARLTSHGLHETVTSKTKKRHNETDKERFGETNTNNNNTCRGNAHGRRRTERGAAVTAHGEAGSLQRVEPGHPANGLPL